jgi:hypothetical protein
MMSSRRRSCSVSAIIYARQIQIKKNGGPVSGPAADIFRLVG